MQIKFTGNAQVRGRGYVRGEVADFDVETCNAYIQAGQAQPYVESPKTRAKAADADPDGDEDTGEDDKPAENQTTRRGGRNVRTATKPKGEQR
jgi:hypothetical protein